MIAGDARSVEERIAVGEALLIRAVMASAARDAGSSRPPLLLLPAIEEADDA
jgi:hypothetical protein